MEVLIIIDVQPGFSSSSQVIDSCRRLVDQFLGDQKPIFVLESLDFGHTYTKVVEPLLSYPKAFFCKKEEMDGSEQIWNVWNTLFEVENPRFHLCGIYRNQCVLSTAIGLAERFPQSKIVARDEAIDCGLNSDLWRRLGPQIRLYNEQFRKV